MLLSCCSSATVDGSSRLSLANHDATTLAALVCFNILEGFHAEPSYFRRTLSVVLCFSKFYLCDFWPPSSLNVGPKHKDRVESMGKLQRDDGHRPSVWNWLTQMSRALRRGKESANNACGRRCRYSLRVFVRA